MKRKVILYITSFALCTIISLYSIKSMDVTGKETDVQEDIYLAQVTEDKESIKSTKPLKKAQLLEDASVETSAMAMWEYNGEKTFVSWLFNNKEEKEIVNYFNGIKLGDTVKDLDVSKLKDDMYGIRIGRKDGTFAGITWIDGYVFMENGDVYKADIDFKSIKKYLIIFDEVFFLLLIFSIFLNIFVLCSWLTNYKNITSCSTGNILRNTTN